MALSKSLDVSLATVQHWVKIGLDAHKEGSRWEVKRADLKAFLLETKRLIGAYPKRTDRTDRREHASKTSA